MSAPITKTTVNDPNATRAAKRLCAELLATDEFVGAVPAIDGGSTGRPVDAAGGVAGVVGAPAAGKGAGRERLGFAPVRGIPEAAFRSMMTVP